MNIRYQNFVMKLFYEQFNNAFETYLKNLTSDKHHYASTLRTYVLGYKTWEWEDLVRLTISVQSSVSSPLNICECSIHSEEWIRCAMKADETKMLLLIYGEFRKVLFNFCKERSKEKITNDNPKAVWFVPISEIVKASEVIKTPNVVVDLI
jgi:hypothetical protein